MIETIVSVELPINEKLELKKHRIMPLSMPEGKCPRISIVTGIHGDELEGQYVCYEVQRRIQENIQSLTGIVDIYPAINPLGIASIQRGIPAFDLDMNRIFPGNEDGSMSEYVAAKVIDDVKGSNAAIDIHASNIFLTEIPQVRINHASAKTLVPLAEKLNVDFIWVHEAATVLQSTFAHSLNSIGTPVLVVEMGVGMRITQSYGNQLTDGIFSLMKHLGIWSGEVTEPRKPIISYDKRVQFINAESSGIFIPKVVHNSYVHTDEHVGDIVSPLTGEILHKIKSPCDGLLFTLRDYPVVDEGSLIARILGGIEE
ncbi:MAG: M14 family metallopeptidase [Candidatus Ornithomonoglobus sp.]